MYIIQDCPICYLDFDAERKPYCTPCGHIFCRGCLHNSISRSPHCPTCRAPCTRASIHKLVCTHEDERQPNSGRSSQRQAQIEGRVWQEVSASIRPGSGYEQRQELVRRNIESIIYEPGATSPLHVAMDTMRLLVKVEKSNQALEQKIETARVTEGQLRSYIRFLEGEISSGEYVRRSIPSLIPTNAGPLQPPRNVPSFELQFNTNQAQRDNTPSRDNATSRGTINRRSSTQDVRRMSLQLEVLEESIAEYSYEHAPTQGLVALVETTRRAQGGQADNEPRSRSNRDVSRSDSRQQPLLAPAIARPRPQPVARRDDTRRFSLNASVNW
ncbi:hypothetical protein FRC08_006201 [Ceratobasidium sp. 394]|nr:hypothetical protein FRC08_006201 [Ceratobasidium sp. 394]